MIRISDMTMWQTGEGFSLSFREKIELAINTTSIGAMAFKNCRSLTEIFIPATVTSIGAYAFSGCFSLTIKYAGISIPPMWDIDWNKNGGTVEFIY